MAGYTPNPRTIPTMLTGVRDPTVLTTPRVKIEMDDEMYWVLPEATPLLVMLNKVRDTEQVDNYLFQWMRMEEMPRTATVLADVAAGATALTVSLTEVNYFVANHVCEILETEELVHATVVTVATGVLTITRSLNGINKPIPAGSHISVVAPAFRDGAAKGTYQSMVEIPDFNYSQCFRRGFGHTFRALQLGVFGGKDPATTEQQVAIEHRLDQELSLLYGTRYYEATGAAPLSMAGGLRDFVETNVWNLGGVAPTVDDFFSYMEYAMRYGDGGYMKGGSGLKYALCSSRWLTWFAQQTYPKVQYEPLQEKLGIKAQLLGTPHGDLVLVKSPILDRDHSGDMWIVDPNHARKVVFGDYDTMLREDIETPGDARKEKEFYADLGWKFTSELPFGRITGLPR